MRGFLVLLVCVVSGILGFETQGSMPSEKEFVNSIGMKFVRIEAGSFKMGLDTNPLSKELASRRHQLDGDPDEQPTHDVTISKPLV